MSGTLQEHIREKAAGGSGRESSSRLRGRNRSKGKAIIEQSREQRRAEVWRLRLECRMTEGQIAEHLGVAPSSVHDDLASVTRRNIMAANESWAVHRQLSLERLEKGIDIALNGAGAAEKELERIAYLDQYRKFVVEEAKLRGLYLKGQESAPEEEKLNDDQLSRIVLMLANPSEQVKGLIVKALRYPGSTLAECIREMQRMLPIDTQGEESA